MFDGINENPSTADKHGIEQVPLLVSMPVSECEFVKVLLEILGAHVVVHPDKAALE